ncbi:MAG: tetratricopeptide repeat protein, partial [Gemmatimonadota bacterium]
TRTDVYSLGLMLYELMVGALPFDLATRPEVTIPHTLRERDTPRPSTRFTNLGEPGTVVADRRRTTRASLRHELKGDLDWIILKAMDKDRTRRYDTAHGLALDVQRHLAAEPVLARPPSARYRVSKFVQRHRAGAAASAIAIAAILLGAGAATTGFIRARRAQLAAERAAETAQETSDFLVTLFHVSDPSEARGNTVTAREILDRGAIQIDTQLAGQPAVQARMMHIIGRVYTELGLYTSARPLLQQAVDLYRTVGDQDSLLQSLTDLGDLDRLHGSFVDAEGELKEAIELGKRLYGPDDVRVAPATNELGILYVNNSHPREAVPLLRTALHLYERSHGPESTDMATMLNNLSTAYIGLERYDSAQVFAQRALAMRTKLLPPNSPRLAHTWLNLGVTYYYQGQYAEAEKAYDHARAIFEKVLGPDHPFTAFVLNNLAEVYWRQKRYDESERLFDRALAIKRKHYPPDHPSIAITLDGLANVYRDEGRYTEAEPLYRRAIEIQEKQGPDNPDLATALSDYATFLERTGHTAAADSMKARSDRVKGVTTATH